MRVSSISANNNIERINTIKNTPTGISLPKDSVNFSSNSNYSVTNTPESENKALSQRIKFFLRSELTKLKSKADETRLKSELDPKIIVKAKAEYYDNGIEKGIKVLEEARKQIYTLNKSKWCDEHKDIYSKAITIQDYNLLLEINDTLANFYKKAGKPDLALKCHEENDQLRYKQRLWKFQNIFMLEIPKNKEQ